MSIFRWRRDSDYKIIDCTIYCVLFISNVFYSDISFSCVCCHCLKKKKKKSESIDHLNMFISKYGHIPCYELLII